MMMQEVNAGSRRSWMGLAAAVWVMVAAGSAYAFPLYSHSLKSVLGYSQRQLTMLGVANDVGENFGLVAGLVSGRFHPRVLLLVGAACCFLGFGLLWLAVTHIVTGLPFLVLCIALCIGTNSSAWLITCVLVTNMRDFPLRRGIVSGILKGYVGHSASVFTGLYASVLHSSSTNLLLFLAVGLPATCLAVTYFVQPCTPSLVEDSSESHHFRFIQVSSIILVVYIFAITILNKFVSLGNGITGVLFGVILRLLLAPFAIPVKMTFFRTRPRQSTDAAATSPSSSTSSAPLLPTSSSANVSGNLQEIEDDVSDVSMILAAGEGAAVRRNRRPRRGENFELLEATTRK